LAVAFMYFVEMLIMIVSIVFGYFVGSIVYNLLSSIFDYNNLLFYWIVVFIIIVSFVLLKNYIQNLFTLILCSLFGALYVARGVGMIVGGFSDEGYLIRLYKHNELTEMHKEINLTLKNNFLYFILTCISGLILNYILHMKNSNKEEEKTKKDEVKEDQVVEEKKPENQQADPLVEQS